MDSSIEGLVSQGDFAIRVASGIIVYALEAHGRIVASS